VSRGQHSQGRFVGLANRGDGHLAQYRDRFGSRGRLCHARPYKIQNFLRMKLRAWSQRYERDGRTPCVCRAPRGRAGRPV
jgi:hypothetical protein